MPAQHIYRDASDIGGWAHETTHGLNSNLRNRSGMRNVNAAFYVGTDGSYALLLEPPTTLREIAKRIPEEWRDSTYQLYLIDQAKWWNEQPLYLLEEASAYYNGAAIAIKREPKGGSTKGRIKNCIKFCYYTVVLRKMVLAMPDERYSQEDKNKLSRVVQFHLSITYQMLRDAWKDKLTTEEHQAMWLKVVTYK